MAHHYSTKDFSRQMPNALLSRYFLGRGVRQIALCRGFVKKIK